MANVVWHIKRPETYNLLCVALSINNIIDDYLKIKYVGINEMRNDDITVCKMLQLFC